MRFRCLFFLLVILIASIAGGSLVLAYTEKTVGGNLIATLTPKQPRAGEEVTIKLTSYEIDLDTAPISWEIDETEVASDIGLKQYTLKAGTAGEIKGVVARVTRPDGSQIVKSIGFQDSSLDLTYSSDSYTPPFYRGHSLPGAGSSVRVVANPLIYSELGELVPNNKLLFRWKIGPATLTAASGLGKNTAKIKLGPLFSETILTVEVSDSASGNKIWKTLTLKAEEPKLVFYRADPLSGVEYNRALPENYKLAGSEETLRVEPYFFSLSSWAGGKLDYVWSMDDKLIEGEDSNQQSINLSRPSSGSGYASLNVKVSNTESVGQNASHLLHFQY